MKYLNVSLTLQITTKMLQYLIWMDCTVVSVTDIVEKPNTHNGNIVVNQLTKHFILQMAITVSKNNLL